MSDLGIMKHPGDDPAVDIELGRRNLRMECWNCRSRSFEQSQGGVTWHCTECGSGRVRLVSSNEDIR